MWFLGFLFAFSLLALPLFTWLKGESGRTPLSRLAGLCERRGAILLFVLPVVLVRVCLHSFFPEQQSWADFFSHGTFFVLGYALFADARFLRAIRRDWSILLATGTVAILAAIAIVASIESFDIEQAPRTPLEFVLWGLIAACSWCWTAFTLSLAMRHLDRDTRVLRYGQATLLPFFVVHQPAILAVAYFVVQWEASIAPKLLVLIFGAFALSIGLTEFVIKRVGMLRVLFGMKPLPKPPAAQATEAPGVLPSA
jgi:hypothetical protein